MICRFFLFLLMTSGLYSQITVEPLYEEYYRPGAWWPLRVSLPSSVPKNIDVSIENFRWKFEKTSEYIGYFLVAKKQPNCKIYQTKKILYDKYFSLQKLKKSDHLIGVYSSQAFTAPTSSHFFANLKWIPDTWQGLNALNAFVLHTNLNKSAELVLQQWVRAGGLLFVTAKYIPKFMQRPNFSQKSIDFGRGKVIFFKHLSAPEIIQLYQKQHHIQMSQISPPPIECKDWPVFFQGSILGWCLLHFMFIMVCAKKIQKNKVVALAVFTLVTMVIFYLWFGQYDKIAHNKWKLYHHLPKNPVVQKRQIHSFTSLQTQRWRHFSATLFFPLQEKTGIIWLRKPGFWGVEIEKFRRNTSYHFMTLDTEEFLGSVTLENQHFANHIEMDWGKVYKKHHQRTQFIGDGRIGAVLNISQGQPAEKSNIFQKWLKNQLPENTLFSFFHRKPGIFISHYVYIP